MALQSSPSRGVRWPTTPGPFGIAEAVDKVFLEMELNGENNGWTIVTSDLLIDPNVAISYGIGGTDPLDLVASSGQFSFALNNSEFNSAGKLGYYSPGHVNVRPGFNFGIAVRWRRGQYTKFLGWLNTITPDAGIHGTRRTVCTALDWMDYAAKSKPVVETQVNKRADEVFLSVVSSVDRPPREFNIDTADSVFPFSLDNSKSESQPVISEIQRICQSEFGRAYITGSYGGGGVLNFERRTKRLTPTPVATFSGTKTLVAPLEAADVKNRIQVRTHPREVGSSGTDILFNLKSIPQVAPGKTLRVTGRYLDPSNRAERVGGMDMITPVSGTDYLMNTQPNGSGVDLTSSFTVVAILGGNSVEYQISNGSASVGYITKLQARGRVLLDYSAVDAEFINQASIDLVGENPVTLDMVYQSDLAVAESIAEFIATSWTVSGANGIKIGFVPRTKEELDLAYELEPGTSIIVTEEVTGIAGTYFIQNVGLTIQDGSTPFIWECQRALMAEYWTLGIVGKSELGINTYLAPL